MAKAMSRGLQIVFVIWVLCAALVSGVSSSCASGVDRLALGAPKPGQPTLTLAAVVSDALSVTAAPVRLEPGVVAGSLLAVSGVMAWERQTQTIWARPLEHEPPLWAEGLSYALGGPLQLATAAALYHEGDAQGAYGLLAATGYAGLWVELLKAAVGMPRRQTGEEAPGYAFAGDGFPSGHTAITFAAATFLADRYPKLKPLAVAAGLGVVVARIASGAHRPSEVLAGAAVGMFAARHVELHSKILSAAFSF